MLTGTYQRTLDAKQRVTLPATYRKELDDQVCLIPFNGALYGFTPDGFKAWVDSQFERGDQHYDPRKLADVRLRRHLTAAAQTIEVDGLFDRGDKHFDSRDLNDVRLKRGLTAACQTIEVDSAGRLALGKLGAKTLAKLAFDHDLTIIGDDDHFEIWDAAKWEAENASFEDDLMELMFGTTA